MCIVRHQRSLKVLSKIRTAILIAYLMKMMNFILMQYLENPV